MKPTVRTDQEKPMRGTRYRIVRGNATPPTPPAVHAMPVARARFLRNQWPTTAMLGVKSSEEEIPPRTPNERKY